MERQWLPSDLARWLRRRSKVRHAPATAQTVSVDHPDLYVGDDYYHGGDPIEDRFPIRSLLTVIAIAVALTVIGLVTVGSLRGGAEDEIIGSPPPTAAPASTAGTVAPSTPSSDAPPPSQPAPSPLDAVVGRILFELGLTETGATYDALREAGDLLGDLIDSIKSLVPAYQGRDVDIAAVLTLLYESGQLFQDAGFNNSVYECGATGPLVVCPPQVGDMPAGTTMVVAMEVAEAIPVASPDRAYRYSVVFDTDGSTTNDWVPVDPFDWDYFQGADRWYQAVYDPGFGWTIQVTQLAADGSIPNEFTVSAARAVIDQGWIVWFIPVDELGGRAAPWRVSAFGHDGSFSEESRGGDVIGSDPTEPLLPPPTEPVFVVSD